MNALNEIPFESKDIIKFVTNMGDDVFHSTTKDFKEFGFVSKNNEADIGFHEMHCAYLGACMYFTALVRVILIHSFL